MLQDRFALIESKCREQGLALTVQRRTILKELLGRKDHPTADQIYDSVTEQLPGLSRTTVYRVLDTFVRIGAATRLAHADAFVRFDPNTERHHHLICETCGALEDVDPSQVGTLQVPEAFTSGYSIKDYSINFTGICVGCRIQTN